MQMNLTIKQTREGQWDDQMMNYIFRHLEVLQLPENVEIIQDMDTLFSYINHLVEEFTLSNPAYRKPTSFSICYCRPTCCPPSIHINYINESITIKSSKDEKSNIDSNSISNSGIQYAN